MKNYIIVAIIIILIIVGVVWYKAKSPAPVGEGTVTTEEAVVSTDTTVAPEAEVPMVEEPAVEAEVEAEVVE
jgi:hypothetical protein